MRYISGKATTVVANTADHQFMTRRSAKCSSIHVNGFETDGAGFNVIAVGDGSPGETLHYNYSGPDVAQDGLQYLDLGGTGTLSKTFTLSEQSLVDVSGWFSRRELASGTVKIDILDSSNNVVFSTTSVDLAGASRNTWYLSQAYGQSLAAGTYTLRIQLPNNLNVDNIRVCASRDSDGDGKADRLDIDSDNDGITDNVEAQATRGYKPPSGHDVDRDGLDDAYDANLGGAAASQGLTPVDTDSDGTADVLDADSDNDGIADIAERADGQPTTLTSRIVESMLQDIVEGQGILPSEVLLEITKTTPDTYLRKPKRC